MGMPLQHALICIVGPTASGKTALAQALAKRLDSAVLSADSMQVYTGMDIGTGKIKLEDRTVPYYGLDLVKPDEAYSVSLFQNYARTLIDERDRRGEQIVMCGGTGFYIRAVIDDFAFPAGEQVGNEIRDFYTQKLEQEGSFAVWEALNELDPASAAVIPPRDSKRVIRALEMLDEGISYAEQKEQFSHIEPYYPSVQIGLQVEPEVLAERINARVDTMMEEGLLDEVKGLLASGYRDAITSQQAIGYKEFVAYLDGQSSLDEAIDAVKLATRRYAKRQRTWFRKDTRIHWLEATDFNLETLTTFALDVISKGTDE